MIRKLSLLPIFLILLAIFSIMNQTFARVGVGIGTGRIVVDEILKPGMVYQLPPLSVVNTGDEPAPYSVGVSFHQDQTQKMPAEEWFVFSPHDFQLDPGGSQTVEVTLRLPLATEPGEYFAYLQAFPNLQSEGGATLIGIAAAAKLEFTVEPANMLAGIYYRLLFFWRQYQPWTAIALAGLAFMLFAAIFRRLFSFELNVKKRKPVNE